MIGSEKIFRIAGKVTTRILSVFFILAILTGVYLVLDAYHVYQNVDAGTIARFKPEVISEETLRELSGEAVAWLMIDDTKIDYPVMQTDNNRDYLNKDFQGNYSIAGSIFLDFRCSPDFTDPYSIIYGHHMAEGLMFGALDAFSEKEYFDSHRTGSLMTKAGTIPFRTVAYVITTTECDEIFDTAPGVDYAAFFAENAMNYDPTAMGNCLLALTTCKDPATTDRAALVLSLQR